MDLVKNIFWNEQENRLRTLFRFIVFLLIAMASYPISKYLLNPLALELPYSRIIIVILNLVLFMLVVWLTVIIADRRKFSEIGFRVDKEWWINFVFGLFLGAFILSFVFLIEVFFGWVVVNGMFYSAGPEDFTVEWIAGLVLYIAVGIREEVVSRGYMIKNISEGSKGSKLKPATILILVSILTSVLFGLGHAYNPNATLISTWNIMVVGILLAYAYIATGSLAVSIGIHITWNFFQGCIFGFPVSGNPVTASLFKITQHGSEIWTGGNFGPEGGLIIYIGSFLGFISIYLWQKVKKGGIDLKVEIADYIPRERENP